MPYRALLARLFAARRFGVVLGLERMRALLDALGGPDRRLGTVIHVGGTNGKGSTVAMIAAIARAAGLRVAAYTSPHLTTVRERIAIDGVPISEVAFVAAAERVRGAGGDALTFFEQLTAIACVAIADAGVDVTVLEVGLGGRLDATNAVAAPPIAVVTGVAMDHEAILGDTLAKIVVEKAGIFKPGQRVVIGAAGEPEAVPMLQLMAGMRGVPTLTIIGSHGELDRAREREMMTVETTMAWMSEIVDAARRAGLAPHGSHAGPPPSPLTVLDEDALARVPAVALPGAHQRANAAAALAAIDHLERVRGIRIDDAIRARALATVEHPGRFEIIAGSPPIILDGAHNPHGAAALADTLRARGEACVLVLGLSADKDARAIVRALAPAVTAIIATRYQQERALEPDALAAIAREVTSLPVEVAPDLAAADARARAYAQTIVIAGSLFLVGEARVRYLGAAADPIALSDPAPSPGAR